jgi:hypothetical protein
MNALSVETHSTDAAGQTMINYCPQHPKVETQMRCNKCGKLICLKCAARTPVGYRCRECVYQQQNVYFNAKGHEDFIAFLVAFGLTCLTMPIVAFLADSFSFGAFYLAFLAGPSAGILLAQAVRIAVSRRRSRYMNYFMVSGLATGLLLVGVAAFVMFDLVLLFDLPVLIFAFLAITTGYQWLK